MRFPWEIAVDGVFWPGVNVVEEAVMALLNWAEKTLALFEVSRAPDRKSLFRRQGHLPLGTDFETALS